MRLRRLLVPSKELVLDLWSLGEYLGNMDDANDNDLRTLWREMRSPRVDVKSVYLASRFWTSNLLHDTCFGCFTVRETMK